MTDSHTLSRVQGCLAGLQIGNARGIAWERKTPEWITERLRGKPLPDFADVKKLRKQKPYAKFEDGMTDDDWQHTRALGHSLVECRGFNLTDIARKLSEEYDVSTVGWGGSSRINMKQIALFFRSGGKEGRDPRMPAKPARGAKGTGNGVAMKIPALGLYWSLVGGRDIHEEFSEVLQIGQMTHADSRASIAAYAIAHIVRLFVSSNTDDHNLDGLAILQSAITRVKQIEKQYTSGFGGNDLMSARLMRLYDDENLFYRGDVDFTTTDPAYVRTTIGTSSFALESVPFAIATSIRRSPDFRAATDEAILAGGDTDTNAAMVGALIGAYVGLDAIPKEMRTFRKEFSEALDLGEELCRVFGK